MKLLINTMTRKMPLLLMACCLFILNIAQSQINFVSSYATNNNNEAVVFATADYAYVSSNQNLIILDISDIQNPISVGTVSTSGIVSAIYVVGDYAYVTSEFDSYGASLSIIDISNPSTASVIGYYESESSIFDVYVVDTYAYLANSSRLRIIDVSDPASPQETGNVLLSWLTKSVTVIDDFAYVGVMLNGVEVVDVSNPNAPVQVGSSNLQNNGWLTDIYHYNGKIYLTGGNDGLVIFERNGTSLDSIGAIDLGRASGVYVDDDYIYLADEDFELLDGGNTSAITVVDSYEPTYSYPSSSVHVAGGYIFLGMYSGIEILELDNNTVSIDNPADASFGVFPNPSNGTFTIELKAAKELTLTVNDALGKKVFQSSYTNVVEGQEVQITLPKTCNGIYYIKLEDGKYVYTEKVVKYR